MCDQAADFDADEYPPSHSGGDRKEEEDGAGSSSAVVREEEDGGGREMMTDEEEEKNVTEVDSSSLKRELVSVLRRAEAAGTPADDAWLAVHGAMNDVHPRTKQPRRELLNLYSIVVSEDGADDDIADDSLAGLLDDIDQRASATMTAAACIPNSTGIAITPSDDSAAAFRPVNNDGSRPRGTSLSTASSSLRIFRRDEKEKDGGTTTRHILIYGLHSSTLIVRLVQRLRPPLLNCANPIIVVAPALDCHALRKLLTASGLSDVYCAKAAFSDDLETMKTLVRGAAMIFCLHNDRMRYHHGADSDDGFRADGAAESSSDHKGLVDRLTVLDSFKTYNALNARGASPTTRSECVVITEILETESIRYYESMFPWVPSTTGHASFRDAISSRLATEVPSFFFDPVFVSGSVALTFTIGAMLHMAFRSGKIFRLIDVILKGFSVEELDCDDMGVPLTPRLVQIPLPEGFDGEPFGELFRHLTTQRLLPIALYRTRKDANSGTARFWRDAWPEVNRFVATCPHQKTRLRATDKVIVFTRLSDSNH